MPAISRSIGPGFKSNAALIVACLLLSTLAYSQGRDGDLRLGRNVREFNFGGGSGGRPVPDARCERGFVAVAFHVQTGEFFNEIWLDCARMRSDGSLGDELRVTDRTGSRGGRAVYDAQCPPGMALRGITGHTGASIDEVIGECTSLRGHEDRDHRHDNDQRDNDRRDNDRRDNDRRDNDRHDNDRHDRNRMEMTAPVTIPRPGGRPAEALCPPDSVLVGFRTRSGEWIDHLSILCSEIERTH